MRRCTTSTVLDRIEKGEIDPFFCFCFVFVVTHRMSLDDTTDEYRMFTNKEDRCVKVVQQPTQFTG